MRVARLGQRRGMRLVAGIAAVALLAAACGGETDAAGEPAAGEDTSGEAGAPGEGDAAVGPDTGVPFGASIEEYQAALADMEPVTIFTQTPGGQGSVSSERFEEYFAAVEEWSGGKIQFDVQFANAVAPPAEIDMAVADGRLDLASTLPTYDPDTYPAVNSLIDITFLGSQTPVVGPLQLLGWTVEAAFSNEEIIAELEVQSLHPLLPIFHSGGGAMICTDPRTSLADFQGVESTATSRVHPVQQGALGVQPVSIAFTEFFEALQRGVVGCATTSLLVGVLGGLYEVAPHTTVDPQAGWAVGTGTFSMNVDVWDSLPLTAKQLLHDRLDVFFEYLFSGVFESYVQAIEAVEANGGAIQPMEADAREALLEANLGLIERARTNDDLTDPAQLIDTAEAAAERWYGIVTDELGYPDDLWYDEFPAWYAENEGTFGPFIERFFEEVMNEYRPS